MTTRQNHPPTTRQGLLALLALLDRFPRMEEAAGGATGSAGGRRVVPAGGLFARN
jgi:hypothetical protein